MSQYTGVFVQRGENRSHYRTSRVLIAEHASSPNQLRYRYVGGAAPRTEGWDGETSRGSWQSAVDQGDWILAIPDIPTELQVEEGL